MSVYLQGNFEQNSIKVETVEIVYIFVFRINKIVSYICQERFMLLYRRLKSRHDSSLLSKFEATCRNQNAHVHSLVKFDLNRNYDGLTMLTDVGCNSFS